MMKTVPPAAGAGGFAMTGRLPALLHFLIGTTTLFPPLSYRDLIGSASRGPAHCPLMASSSMCVQGVNYTATGVGLLW